MSPSTFVKAGIVALAYASQVEAVLKYTLDPSDNYSGDSFFDKWDFFTDNDPTGGFVDYQSQSAAKSKGLTQYDTVKKGSYMGVDYTTSYSTTQTPSNRGRASVRIESKKKYTHGLVIADIGHMPTNVCGTWPAFWSVSHDNYPRWGEIDMLENINEQTQSLNVLHTSPGCTVAANQGGVIRQTGTQASYNCDDLANYSPYGDQSQYQGCAATNTKPANYGKAFNDIGGGIVAMEWTSDSIKMWSFNAGSQPANMASENPDTSTWGLPTFTTQGGVCNIDDHFKEHSLVFDTTFCGTYAGNSYFWEQTSCYRAGYTTCADYVASNPAVFKDAYWLINSVKVYKKTDVVSSTSSSASSTSSTSTSSSASSTSTTSSSSSSSTTSSSSSTSSSASSTSSSSIASTTSSASSTEISSTTSSSTEIPTTTSPSSTVVSPTSSATSTESSSSSLTSSVVSSSETSSVTSVTDSSTASSATSSEVSSTTTMSTSDSVSVDVPTSTDTSLPTTTVDTSTTSSAETSSDISSSTESVDSTTSTTEASTSSTLVSTSSSLVSTTPSTANSPTSSETSSSLVSSTPSTANSPTSSETSASTYSTAMTSQTTTVTFGGHYTNSSSSIPSTTSSYPGNGAGETTEYETSTVYTTSVYTVTSCAPTVTNCPAGPHEVTVTIPLYETICPITKTNVPGGHITSTPVAPHPSPSSHLTVGPGYTTSVVYATTTYTVTACPTYVKNCPVGSVATETKTLYTTLISDVVKPTVIIPVFSFTPGGIFSTISPPGAPTPESVSTIVVVPQPIPSPAAPYSSGIHGSNSTLSTGTGTILVPTKSGSSLTPTETAEFSGAGSQVKVGSALAIVAAAFVMFF